MNNHFSDNAVQKWFVRKSILSPAPNREYALPILSLSVPFGIP